jgi:hypothetical protein
MFQSQLSLVLYWMNAYADDEQMTDSSIMLFATCDVIYMNPKGRELFANLVCS